MALDEPQVITSQAQETVQQTSIFQHLLSFAERCFIIGLQMTFYQANYQFMVLITLLTDEWGFDLFFSVIIVNVYDGAKQVLVVPTTWLGDTYLHNRWILLYSTLSYCLGLGLWCFIFPTYRWEFFFPGLLLILVGQCGYESYLNCKDKRVCVRLQLEENNNSNEEQGESASLNQNNSEYQGVELEEVINNQEPGVDEENDGQDREIAPFIIQDNGNNEYISVCKRITRSTLSKILKTHWTPIFGLIIAMFIFPLGKEGFIILIVLFFASFHILLFMGMFSHNFSTKKLEGSPLSIIFKVYILAFTKRNDDNHGRIIYTGDFNAANPQFDGNIRFLHRAALYNPSKVNPIVEFDQGRLCTLHQVEDTKHFINAMLLSLAFLMYGVMTAVGDTFFVERVNKMDSQIGTYKVPSQLFVMTSNLVKKLVSYICKKIMAKRVQESSRRRFYGALRVGIGMLISVPCFGTALFIEKKRMVDVDISAFWLLPQLILLGLMDGLAVDGVKCFFEQEMPNSIGVPYGGILSDAIVGLGKLLGVGWFCFWYFITMIGNKSGWFGHDIDNSRLDYYYAVMVGFALLSTFVYACIVTKHVYTHQSFQN